MNELEPIIHHYEDYPLVEHYKIWIGVNRVQAEYIRILRLPIKGQIPKKYIEMMKAKDSEIASQYFERLSEKVQDDTLDQLYIENERMGVTLANQSLKMLEEKMKQAILNPQLVEIKDTIVLLKAIEQYANFNRKPSGGEAPQSSLAKLLLGHNIQDSQHSLPLQHQVQRAGSLRLPSSSL
jgi:hypothetical protein